MHQTQLIFSPFCPFWVSLVFPFDRPVVTRDFGVWPTSSPDVFSLDVFGVRWLDFPFRWRKNQTKRGQALAASACCAGRRPKKRGPAAPRTRSRGPCRASAWAEEAHREGPWVNTQIVAPVNTKKGGAPKPQNGIPLVLTQSQEAHGGETSRVHNGWYPLVYLCKIFQNANMMFLSP